MNPNVRMSATVRRMRDRVCDVAEGRAVVFFDTDAATQVGAVFSSFFPKDRQRVGIAEIIRTKLNWSLTTLFAPELFGPLHASLLILKIRQRSAPNLPRTRPQSSDPPIAQLAEKQRNSLSNLVLLDQHGP